MTDRSTQVDFPIVLRKIRRHNTSADLYSTNSAIGNSKIPATSWNHLRSAISRPNLVPEAISPRTKVVFCSENPITRLTLPTTSINPQNHTISNDSTNFPASISRERTPPFSCDSSIASTNYYRPSSLSTSHKKHDEDFTANQCYCKCSDDVYKRIPANSQQELSWKNLHMSRAKLKATATTSELLSGFAMIAMVELQINDDTSVPEWLFVMFAVCTTVLVAVHIFALMISTYILPNIDAIAKLEVCAMVAESPHERMKGFIELAWAFSTVLGLFLFLVEVAILCWVKFWDYSFTAATAATVIVIPVLVTFVLFAVHFYHSLVVYKCNTSIGEMDKLEDMKKHLDEVTVSPV